MLARVRGSAEYRADQAYDYLRRLRADKKSL
jgi:hypothetical protein